jgi:hypothetical protein
MPIAAVELARRADAAAMQAYYRRQQNWLLAISLCAVKYSGNS